MKARKTKKQTAERTASADIQKFSTLNHRYAATVEGVRNILRQKDRARSEKELVW
jgi:hypothetical protein